MLSRAWRTPWSARASGAPSAEHAPGAVDGVEGAPRSREELRSPVPGEREASVAGLGVEGMGPGQSDAGAVQIAGRALGDREPPVVIRRRPRTRREVVGVLGQ